jgi:hypothetical protein
MMTDFANFTQPCACDGIHVQVGGTASCYTVSGAVDGTVCLWNGHTLSESQRVHTTAVSAITTLPPPEGTTGTIHLNKHIVNRC